MGWDVLRYPRSSWGPEEMLVQDSKQVNNFRISVHSSPSQDTIGCQSEKLPSLGGCPGVHRSSIKKSQSTLDLIRTFRTLGTVLGNPGHHSLSDKGTQTFKAIKTQQKKQLISLLNPLTPWTGYQRTVQ